MSKSFSLKSEKDEGSPPVAYSRNKVNNRDLNLSQIGDNSSMP